MSASDPRQRVEEPVRRALTGVIVGGLAFVAAVAVVALWPAVLPVDAATRDAVAVGVPATLVAYAVLVNIVRVIRGRTPAAAREVAWTRAREVDPEDAWLGRMISGWVPFAVLIALGVLVWPHLTDRNPSVASAWVVLGLPPVVLAWIFAGTTWLDACRDDLARAEREADSRFRTYWANPTG